MRYQVRLLIVLHEVIKIKDAQYDSVIELPKEKIYAEKIKSKLMKHLEISNANDLYFNQQLNILCNLFLRRLD